KEGAPYDLFLSADVKYPEALHALQLTDGPPRIYARGQLMAWTLREDLLVTSSRDIEANDTAFVNILLSDEVRRIAIANPDIAPYGAAAVQYFTQQGVYEQLKDKLVFGESIAQTNQFILSGAAELGFTARSVSAAPEVSGKGNWVAIDPTQYAPIEQGVVVLRNRPAHLAKAQKFRDFLFSESGQNILKTYGYLVSTAAR
ncbi:MAG: molybdate ABC transporter substrate-binding protein, partial [Bacteroidota bacterium]